jgi:hypothetical protein
MPKERKLQPRQRQQHQPGREHKMRPRPKAQDEKYRGSEKLRDKVAIITGGDSGIGRAVAIAFAKEGADVAVVYLEEEKDANETKRLVEEHGRKCLLIAGDVGQEGFCRKAIAKTIKEFDKIDILVNNAAEQYPQDSIEKITEKQLERTFRDALLRLLAAPYLRPPFLPPLRELDLLRFLPRPPRLSSDRSCPICLRLPMRGAPLLCC